MLNSTSMSNESCNLFMELCNTFKSEYNDLYRKNKCMKRALKHAFKPKTMFIANSIQPLKNNYYRMKKLRLSLTIVLLSFILVGMTSCEVTHHVGNERHGWFNRHDDREHHQPALIIVTPEIKSNREHNYDPD